VQFLLAIRGDVSSETQPLLPGEHAINPAFLIGVREIEGRQYLAQLPEPCLGPRRPRPGSAEAPRLGQRRKGSWSGTADRERLHRPTGSSVHPGPLSIHLLTPPTLWNNITKLPKFPVAQQHTDLPVISQLSFHERSYAYNDVWVKSAIEALVAADGSGKDV